MFNATEFFPLEGILQHYGGHSTQITKKTGKICL